MNRITLAEHTAQAFHEPERLADERRMAIAAAGAPAPEMSHAELAAYGRRLIADIDKAKLVS